MEVAGAAGVEEYFKDTVCYKSNAKYTKLFGTRNTKQSRNRILRAYVYTMILVCNLSKKRCIQMFREVKSFAI